MKSTCHSSSDERISKVGNTFRLSPKPPISAPTTPHLHTHLHTRACMTTVVLVVAGVRVTVLGTANPNKHKRRPTTVSYRRAFSTKRHPSTPHLSPRRILFCSHCCLCIICASFFVYDWIARCYLLLFAGPKPSA